MGKLVLPGLPWRLSNTHRGNFTYQPLLDEHNNYVLGDILGLSSEEIARLVEEKVVY